MAYYTDYHPAQESFWMMYEQEKNKKMTYYQKISAFWAIFRERGWSHYWIRKYFKPELLAIAKGMDFILPTISELETFENNSKRLTHRCILNKLKQTP